MNLTGLALRIVIEDLLNGNYIMAKSDLTSAELQRLIARCALRDRHAFSAIYQATSAGVFGFLMNMLRDKAAAEEVLQDAYMQVWQKASTYTVERGQPLTWIISLARYRGLDHLRRQSTRRRNETKLALESLGQEFSLDQYLDANDNDQYLATCLDRLNDNARESVVKAYCEGYTHEELSASMDAPIGTVKSWIRRSIRKLRECLNELSTS